MAKTAIDSGSRCTEGVVELTQWIEKMETVFRISSCSVEYKIKFSICTLLGNALTWWNSHVRTVGNDVAYEMTWTELKKKMTDKYCLRTEIKKLEVELMFPEESDKIERYVGGLPDMIHGSVVASKPNTMQEATKIATELMDKRICTFAKRQTENKRKQDDNQQQQQQNKRQNTGRAYTAGTGEKKPYGGSKPLCAKCNYHHDGPCAPKCHKCNRVGHLARDCRSPANTNASNNQRGTRAGQKPTCYECGNQGHYKSDCLELKNRNHENQAEGTEARGMVFNTIITSLKALDESFSSRNHVRKFLRALPSKWRPKVTAIEESKDLSKLSLDELVGNLKVYEVVLEKDLEIAKNKKEKYKSLALKARQVLSDDDTSSSDSNDEEYAMAVRDFKKFFRRRGKFVRQPYDDKKNFRKIKEDKREDRRCFKCGDPNHFISDCPKNSSGDQKAFVVGSWSDSGDDSKKEEICLMAHSNEVLSDNLYYSSSSLDNESRQNEYDKLCQISLRIINKNKHLKAKNESLKKTINEHKTKLDILEKGKSNCDACNELRLEVNSLKLKLASFENSSSSLQKMVEMQKPSKDKCGLGYTETIASPRNTKIKNLGGHLKKLSVEPAGRCHSSTAPACSIEQHRVSDDSAEKEKDLETNVVKQNDSVKQVHESHKSGGARRGARGFECLMSEELFAYGLVWSVGRINYEGELLQLWVIVDDIQSKAYVVLNKETMKVEESLNVKFDETSPPPNSPPLVDDDLLEVNIIENQRKDLEVKENEPLNKQISNIKESKDHPLGTNLKTLKKLYKTKVGVWLCKKSSLNLKQMTFGVLNNARLVAQGYNQQEGIDFNETYAPVARLESIRILLAYACAHDFKLFQMDVKIAFLNGFINEEMYVAQPPGFVDFEKPNHAFKLKKALSDLKQAPKAWYDRLKSFLLDHSYTMSLVDNTLFTKKKDSHIIIVQIYVDDIIFGSTCQDLCDDFSKIMHDEFEMSMMGELNFFLGLQIKQFEDGIFFNQSKYVKEMLKKFGLENAKPIKTPMSSETKLTCDEEGKPIDDTKYHGTSHLGLWYPKGTGLETIVYVDSDYAGDYVDQKSTSGVCTFVGCCLTSWMSKKQTALAISTTEA
ncbi:retrovirus-related pol polyprotein from transposon TNT 1-94 [Tanacetum coccineum]